MYFVTTICRKEGSRYFDASRCFGYCNTALDAIRAVLNNYADIHEELYTHAVIEKIGPGFHPMPEMEIWFKWDEDKEKWTLSSKPSWSEHIINWAIG